MVSANAAQGRDHRSHVHSHGGRTSKLGHSGHHRRAASSGRRPVPVRSGISSVLHLDLVSLENDGDDDKAPSPAVLAAILDAARDARVDPDILMAFAWRESRYKADAKSSRSAARGLLQFTPATWLETVRDFGRQYGAPRYAAAIHTERSGRITIRSFRIRQHILLLRGNPAFSARMAAAVMARQDLASQRSLGRSPTSVELYLLHALGQEGAARFLTARAQRPSESSLRIASLKTLYDAGLLAEDGRPMTVGNTYTAIDIMLKRHQVRRPPVAEPGDGSRIFETADRNPYGPATFEQSDWCGMSNLILCQKPAAGPMIP